MAEKPPAFQFYPKDFLSDDAVSMMTNEQIGAYVLLLSHAWLKPEGLPLAPSSLAKLARCTEKRFAEQVWPGIADRFVEHDGHRFNPRLENERAKQDAFREERSRSGKRGAATKYGWLSDGSAIKQPVAKSSSSSAICNLQVQEPPNPPLRGGRKLTAGELEKARKHIASIGGCPHGIAHEIGDCARMLALYWRGEQVSA